MILAQETVEDEGGLSFTFELPNKTTKASPPEQKTFMLSKRNQWSNCPFRAPWGTVISLTPVFKGRHGVSNLSSNFWLAGGALLVGSAFLGETLGLGFQQIHSDARQGCEAGRWAGSSDEFPLQASYLDIIACIRHSYTYIHRSPMITS